MKKTFLMVSAAIVALAFVACGGQGGNKDENAGDSAALAAQADSAAVVEDAAPADAVLNADLLGKWSNNNDPAIDMFVADKLGNYDDNKGFGYIMAANEYFEYDFLLVFTSVTPDGDNIRVHYNKLESFFTGDPDNYDSEDGGEWVSKTVGEGDLTLIPQGAGKVKIDSQEKRINKTVLSKVQ
jgi:hypothetical protein